MQKKKSGNEEGFLKKIKRSFTLIKENKFMFFLVFFSTIIFITSALMIVSYYTIEAVTHQQVVLDYLSNLDTQGDPMASPLGTDPLFIYQEIAATKKAFLLLGTFLLADFLILNGLVWFLVKLIREKSRKLEFLKSYSIVFFTYLILMALTIYPAYRIFFTNTDTAISTPMMIVGLILTAVLLMLLYLYGISISLTTNSTLLEIPKKTLKNAKKIWIALPTFLIPLALVSLLLYLINAYYDTSELILSISLILIFLIAAYSRVLFSSVFD